MAQLEKAAEKDKSFLLRRLIAYCIEIKNFTYASQYIRRYIELKYENWESYQAFLWELQELFAEIKKNILARKQGDIVVNWVDNANAKELYESELGKHLSNNALFFTEAYTNCPWTHFTHNGIFTEKYAISGKTYNNFHHTTKTSKLLATLESKGYVFKYIANPGLYQGEFDEGYAVTKPKGFENVRWKAGGRVASECSTRLQWWGLRERLLSSKPLCLWIHNVAEPLYPFAYISGSSFREYDPKGHAKGLAFLAHQLVWYSQFESPYQHSIYFDDHGDVDKNLSAYKKGRCNVGMIIKSYRVQPGDVDGLYSHVDFYKIIKELLSDNKFDFSKIFCDYIIFENPDLYNEEQCKSIIKHWRDIKGVDMSYFQVVAVRTKKDLYARYALGKEIYYLLPDEENNRIDLVEYRDRIIYLKSLITTKFIDIHKEEKFKNSHMLYDYLNEVSKEKIKY